MGRVRISYASFEKIIVPDAANQPPTPWRTEILAPGTWAAAMLRILYAAKNSLHVVRRRERPTFLPLSAACNGSANPTPLAASVNTTDLACQVSFGLLTRVSLICISLSNSLIG